MTSGKKGANGNESGNGHADNHKIDKQITFSEGEEGTGNTRY